MPLAVAPFKAEDGLPPTDVPLRVTDFMDGTMINCFRMGNHIQIATRTSIGANGTFYSQRSFASLFEDALEPYGGSYSFLDSVLGENMFISCVLQHPEHVTVEHVVEPRFFVTHVGTVAEDGTVVLSSAWPARLLPFAPKEYEERTLVSDANGMLEALHMKHTWQGLMFQSDDGRRWRLRNPAYVLVRGLRGSESNPLERFLRLRKNSQMKDYLSYFREESEAMWRYEENLRGITQLLYDAYVKVNKLKNSTFKDYHVSLRPHIYALHGMYLTTVGNGIPTPILKDTVVGYVNGLAIPDQMNLIRWSGHAAAVAVSMEDKMIGPPVPGPQPGPPSYASVVAHVLDG